MKKLLVPFVGLSLSFALFSASAWFVQEHLRTLAAVRDTALPLAAELPPLEERYRILSEQVELAELQAQMRSGTAEEKLRAFVLPESTDLPRLIALFDVLGAALESRGVLKEISAVEVQDARDFTFTASGSLRPSQGLEAQRLTFTAVVNEDGSKQIVDLLDMSGLITVGDVLSARDMRGLLALTEEQKYSGIVPVEQFLSTDLLTYLRDPTMADERLMQAFPSEEFLSRFRSLLEHSRLHRARELLEGDLAGTLADQKLWPSPFIVPQVIDVRENGDGWITLSIEADVISRPSGR